MLSLKSAITFEKQFDLWFTKNDYTFVKQKESIMTLDIIIEKRNAMLLVPGEPARQVVVAIERPAKR